MLLLFIICFKNVDCDIYNVFYFLYIECEINLSTYLPTYQTTSHDISNIWNYEPHTPWIAVEYVWCFILKNPKDCCRHNASIKTAIYKHLISTI